MTDAAPPGDRGSRAREPTVDNRTIAQRLERVSALLQTQGDGPFRVRAYQRAADTLRALPREVAEIAREGGVDALEALPNIGPAIASAIVELLDSGRLRFLERLEGEVCPAALFASLPGLGPTLAQRIADTLHLETLEDLEAAAHDGRLASVPGLGARRVAGLRDVLDAVLRRRRSLRTAVPPRVQPPIAALLELDRRYREGARAGTLPTIAPRRFNPKGEAWLPVLHDELAGFHLTGLFSNTARAHRLNKTHDWVVIFYQQAAGQAEGQCTVVTESQGALRGKRVVRGREAECRAHYQPPHDEQNVA